ncbi:hypothetical protein BH23ACT9_BH23ACT9_18610 [soil metagenome]
MSAADPDGEGRPELGDSGPSDAAVVRRILRFEQALRARVATTTRALPFGIATLCPDLPLFRGASGVEVVRPAAVSEVLTAIDPLFAEVGLPHRRITTAVAEVAWLLAPALIDRGWRSERLLTMVHDGTTAPMVSALGFQVVDHERYAPVGRRMLADAGWGRDPAVQDDVEGYERRLAEAFGARFVIDLDGVSGCHVHRHGPIAQIQSVNVLREHRGRGLGTGLLAAAMAQCADAAVRFIVADVDDWPQHWYRRLGFRPVAAGWGWTLDPPAR